MIIKYLYFFLLVFLAFFINCQDGKQANSTANKVTDSQFSVLLNIESPQNGSSFIAGEKIKISLKKTKESILIDSIKLYVNNIVVTTLSGSTTEYNWDTKNAKMGSTAFRAEAFHTGHQYSTSVVVHLKPKNKPKELKYKIIKIYPHSRDAYTQGLIYENGIFYESDGQYDKSTLRKVKPETGEAVNYAILPPRIFAEGIAIFEDKIYQISWREKTCFIYDKKTFTLERQVQYTIDEGWGLTFDGKNFLMTDGSNIVYIIDPLTFTETDRIEVMDNTGPVESLNELEYINGMLYANVYQTNYIVVIDPNTGEVKARLNFAGILLKDDYRNNTDVLNGIAYNPDNKHLYITGKYWPKLFEVSIFDDK